MTFQLKAGTYLAQPELDAVRTKGQDLANAEDWPGLLAIRPELEADTELWPDLWGPTCALAARKLGQPGAIELLEELVRGGFTQPELFAGELERAFADDPGWPVIATRMAASDAPPPIVLTEWPVLTPSAPLCLLEVPGRAEELRAQLPAPQAWAWDTAMATLAWVTSRWKHANAHMEIDDAIECLQRVDHGERFACVEYSLVLTQALNALAIPGRRVSLRQQNYHAGVGRGHVVSEAWIDDLGRWVLLDGQNGLYWTGDSGAPMDDDDADLWFTYFAHTTSDAGTWSPGTFGLVFQRTKLHMSRRLEHRPEVLYPDLSELGVETALDGHEPAVRLTAAHPFARGFAAAGADITGDILRLDDRPGEHETSLAVRTDYGLLPGKPLRYTVA